MSDLPADGAAKYPDYLITEKQIVAEVLSELETKLPECRGSVLAQIDQIVTDYLNTRNGPNGDDAFKRALAQRLAQLL